MKIALNLIIIIIGILVLTVKNNKRFNFSQILELLGIENVTVKCFIDEISKIPAIIDTYNIRSLPSKFPNTHKSIELEIKNGVFNFTKRAIKCSIKSYVIEFQNALNGKNDNCEVIIKNEFIKKLEHYYETEIKKLKNKKIYSFRQVIKDVSIREFISNNDDDMLNYNYNGEIIKKIYSNKLRNIKNTINKCKYKTVLDAFKHAFLIIEKCYSNVKGNLSKALMKDVKFDTLNVITPLGKGLNDLFNLLRKVFVESTNENKSKCSIGKISAVVFDIFFYMFKVYYMSIYSSSIDISSILWIIIKAVVSLVLK